MAERTASCHFKIRSRVPLPHGPPSPRTPLAHYSPMPLLSPKDKLEGQTNRKNGEAAGTEHVNGERREMREEWSDMRIACGVCG